MIRLALSVVILATLSNVARAQENKEAMLRDAMQRVTRSSPNPGQNDVLFVRSLPVRAYVHLENGNLRNKAISVISSLANAFGLKLEFTSDEINLLVAEMLGLKQASLEDMKTQFQRWGLPARITPHVLAKGWQSGCFIHLNPTSEGRIGLGVIAIDPSLTEQEKLECVVVAGLAAFGFGDNDQFQNASNFQIYLTLAIAIRQCDLSKPRSQVIDCVAKDREQLFKITGQ